LCPLEAKLEPLGELPAKFSVALATPPPLSVVVVGTAKVTWLIA
jgi:hypothetical protein